jgi:mono/diheme cytochrome c family protein
MKTILTSLNWKATAAASVFALFLPVTFPSSLAAQENAAAAQGKAIFEAKCVACHTVGGGDLVGPDLAGVTVRRDAEWLNRFIRQPDVMIRDKDSTAIGLLGKYSNIAMPNLGIGKSDAAALVAFFAANGRKKAQTVQPSAATSVQLLGSASAGVVLFEGSTPFQNRGTQCFACHNIASISPPGGGSLGPDLTGAAKKYGGERGLIGVLAGIPFPTMVPIYMDHPLLPQEQADLAAYLGASSGSPAAMIVFVACLGVWVMAGLYMILYSLWHRRLGRVRATLQAR